MTGCQRRHRPGHCARHSPPPGADVALLARRRERLEALAGRDPGARDAEPSVVPVDVTNAGGARQSRRRLRPPRSWVHIEILVNNAGGARFLAPGTGGGRARLDQDRWRSTSPRRSSARRPSAAPMIERGGGAIVNVGSVAGPAPPGRHGRLQLGERGACSPRPAPWRASGRRTACGSTPSPPATWPPPAGTPSTATRSPPPLELSIPLGPLGHARRGGGPRGIPGFRRRLLHHRGHAHHRRGDAGMSGTEA